MHINFEFKARHENIGAAEKLLLEKDPLFIGEDHQVDTYFKVPNGRLKLRQGTIEQSLIFYERTDEAAAKQSNVVLYRHQADASLKLALQKSLGIKTVVDKKRRIYFIDNVKFHFDTVQDLGKFIEVEAIDKDGSVGIEKLQDQCRYYQALFPSAKPTLLLSRTAIYYWQKNPHLIRSTRCNRKHNSLNTALLICCIFWHIFLSIL